MLTGVSAVVVALASLTTAGRFGFRLSLDGPL